MVEDGILAGADGHSSALLLCGGDVLALRPLPHAMFCTQQPAAFLSLHLMALLYGSLHLGHIMWRPQLVCSGYNCSGLATLSYCTAPCLAKGLDIDMTKFIDLCIMCGCDYVNNIRGIGPVRAVQLIQKHGSIEVRACRYLQQWGVRGICRVDS